MRHEEHTLEAEIWKLEEAWYAYHRDQTAAKAYALLHDQFLGWPVPRIYKPNPIRVSTSRARESPRYFRVYPAISS